MSLNKKQFERLIRDTLNRVDPKLCTDDAVNLLLGTAAIESDFGTYLYQVSGPARGVFQIEPTTEDDIWHNYLAGRPWITYKIPLFSTPGDELPDMVYNLAYQIIMARVHYLRVPEKLPADVCLMAVYWKKYYNTEKGKGTMDDFVNAYEKYVL